jgi:hypothetical protein
MTRQKTKPDPYLLAYQEAVPKAYASIINDYNFSLSQTSTESFELRSEVCLISINLDRESVGSNIKPVRIEQVPKAQYYSTIGLGKLINFLDPEANFEYRPCPTPEKLREEIDRLARLTSQYCTPMMEGDFSKWLKLKETQLKAAGVPF